MADNFYGRGEDVLSIASKTVALLRKKNKKLAGITPEQALKLLENSSFHYNFINRLKQAVFTLDQNSDQEMASFQVRESITLNIPELQGLDYNHTSSPQ